jgi:hypothetical protein
MRPARPRSAEKEKRVERINERAPARGARPAAEDCAAQPKCNNYRRRPNAALRKGTGESACVRSVAVQADVAISAVSLLPRSALRGAPRSSEAQRARRARRVWGRCAAFCIPAACAFTLLRSAAPPPARCRAPRLGAGCAAALPRHCARCARWRPPCTSRLRRISARLPPPAAASTPRASPPSTRTSRLQGVRNCSARARSSARKALRADARNTRSADGSRVAARAAAAVGGHGGRGRLGQRRVQGWGVGGRGERSAGDGQRAAGGALAPPPSRSSHALVPRAARAGAADARAPRVHTLVGMARPRARARAARVAGDNATRTRALTHLRASRCSAGASRPACAGTTPRPRAAKRARPPSAASQQPRSSARASRSHRAAIARL